MAVAETLFSPKSNRKQQKFEYWYMFKQKWKRDFLQWKKIKSFQYNFKMCKVIDTQQVRISTCGPRSNGSPRSKIGI